MRLPVPRRSEVGAFRWAGVRSGCLELSRLHVMKRTVLIQVVAVIVVAVFAVGILFTGGTLNPAWLRFFTVAVFVATIALTLWDHVLWRAPVIGRILGAPRNLRGTWRG